MFGTSTFGVTQTFPSARQTRANQQLYERQTGLHEAERSLVQHQLSREVRDIFQHLSYLDEKRNRLVALDSLYQQTARIAESRYRNGEVAADERLAARDQAARIRLDLETISHETAFDREVLARFLGEIEPLTPVIAPFTRQSFSMADTARIRQGAYAMVDAGKAAVSEAQASVEKARRAPLLTAGVNVQYLANGSLYPGYSVGLRLPLAQQNLRARASASLALADAARAQAGATVRSQQVELAHLLHEVEKYEILLEYYEKEGKSLATELRRSAFQRYAAGESDFAELVQSADRALRIEMEYLDNLHLLNRTILEIEMLF
jgi:cobalt-zinc-cadmium resistance protein CzcA